MQPPLHIGGPYLKYVYELTLLLGPEVEKVGELDLPDLYAGGDPLHHE